MSSNQYMNYGTNQFNSENVPILGNDQLLNQNRFSFSSKRNLVLLYLLELVCNKYNFIYL